MANKMRHRYGAKNPVKAEVASATVIDVGSLVYLYGNAVVPFSTKANASLADVNDLFLGVAMQASANGETDPIRVATSGVFEFVIASTTVYLGNTILPVAGTASLENHTVTKGNTGTMTNGIGIAIPYDGTGVASAQTKVLVSIHSAIFDNMLA